VTELEMKECCVYIHGGCVLLVIAIEHFYLHFTGNTFKLWRVFWVC